MSLARSACLATLFALLLPTSALAADAVVPPLVAKGVDPLVNLNLTSLLSSEADFLGLYDNVKQLDKAPTGLTDACLASTTCLGKIARDAGAAAVIAGSVAPGAGKYNFKLIYFDLGKNRIVRTVSFTLPDSPAAIADGMGPHVKEVMTGDGPKADPSAPLTAMSGMDLYADDDDDDVSVSPGDEGVSHRIPTSSGGGRELSDDGLSDGDDGGASARASAAAAQAARDKAAAEAKRRAEDEAAARAAAETAARQKAEAEAKRRAEDEAARQRAEADARQRAEEEAAARKAAAAAAAAASSSSDDDDDFANFSLSSSTSVVAADTSASSGSSSGGSSSSSSSARKTDDDVDFLADDTPSRSSSSSSSRSSSSRYDDLDADRSSSRGSSARSSSSSRYDDLDDKPSSRSSSARTTSTRDGNPKIDRGSSSAADGKVMLAGRLGFAPYQGLGFVSYGAEVAVKVAGGLALAGGLEAYSVQRSIPPALLQPGEASKQWNTILPINLGLQYHFGASTVRPYLGADVLIVPGIVRGRSTPATGGRARAGCNFLVSDMVALNLNGAIGFLGGKDMVAVADGMDTGGVAAQVSVGTVLFF